MTNGETHTANFVLTLYMADWCLDSVLARNALRRAGIPFVEVDIDTEAGAADAVRAVANGKCRVPVAVIEVPGMELRVLIEPSMRELAEAAKSYLPPAS